DCCTQIIFARNSRRTVSKPMRVFLSSVNYGKIRQRAQLAGGELPAPTCQIVSGNSGAQGCNANPKSLLPNSPRFATQEKAGERFPSHRLESYYGTSAMALEPPLAWLSPCASSQEQARYATVLAPGFRQPAFLRPPGQSTGLHQADRRSESPYPWSRRGETRYGWRPTGSGRP